MSKLQVDDIVNKDDTGSVGFSRGAVVTGVMTATTFSGALTGNATGLTGTPNIDCGTGSFTGDVDIADKIVHTGDTNTALRFPAADTFTVETSGSERLRVDSGGRLIVGADSAPSIVSQVRLIVSGESLPNSSTVQVRYDDTTAGPAAVFANARGSTSSPAILQSGDEVGKIRFYGHDGNDFDNYAAQITAAVDGTPGSNDMPGRLVFSTTADGAASPTERLRIDSSGRLNIGSSSAPGTVGGFSHVNVHGTSINANGAIGLYRNSASPSAGQGIGAIYFANSDGNAGAYIQGQSDGSWATNDYPGRLVFFTTADGASSATERLRITSTGRVGINIDNPDSYNSAGNNLVLGDTGNNSGMTIVTSTTNNGHIFFADGGSGGAENRGIIKYEHGNDAMAFNTAEVERLRLTSGGDLLVGHGSVISNMKFGGSGDFGSHAEIIGANKGFANGLAILNYDASASIPAILKLATSRNDTAGSNTAVGNADDNCASIQFMGNDGTRFIDLARIDGVVDGTVGSNDMPGRLAFFTTADGASVVTERMRIQNNGSQSSTSTSHGIEMGITASSSSLNTIFRGRFGATAGSFATGTISFNVFANGDVTNTNNSYTAISDITLKENIVPASSQWDNIKGIEVVNYNFKEETGHQTHKQLGVIAQQVEEVSPGLVKDGEEGLKTVNYSVLYMKAVKALQEAMTRIETLETEVAALKGS